MRTASLSLLPPPPAGRRHDVTLLHARGGPREVLRSGAADRGRALWGFLPRQIRIGLHHLALVVAPVIGGGGLARGPIVRGGRARKGRVSRPSLTGRQGSYVFSPSHGVLLTVLFVALVAFRTCTVLPRCRVCRALGTTIAAPLGEGSLFRVFVLWIVRACAPSVRRAGVCTVCTHVQSGM